MSSEAPKLGHRPDEAKPADWDPVQGEETWYRHFQTGDRGFYCKRSGREMIRMDRPNDPHAIQPFDPQRWIVDRESRPLNAMACAQVAQVADQTLCRRLGLYDKAGKEWLSLPEKTRIAWMNQGPKSPDIRRKLYLAIRAVLEPLEG